MKKILTLFAVAAALMTVSCTKENQAPEAQDGKTIQLTLQATRGEADTKTTISMNDAYHSLESVWAAGDKIYVYSIKSGEKLGVLTLTGDIVNQKASATSQYLTSYAAFIGSITLGSGDLISDTFAFVYQGNRAELSVSEGILTFPIGTSDSVAGLNAWDVAYATGKIQGTEGSASCAVTFTNKVAFGYFTTTPLGSGSDIDMNYFSDFTLNVKTGAFAGVKGTVTVPRNAAFFMPLVPGTVNMTADTEWAVAPVRYRGIQQSISFTAAAGYYYRLGISGEYGPVQIVSSDWTMYETLGSSIFNVGSAETPKNVYFTQGNLQWINTNPADPASGYWKIADSQYQTLAHNNAKGTFGETNFLNPGDMDLFSWGDVNAPFSSSDVDSSYPAVNVGDELPADKNWATKFNGETPTPLMITKTVNYSKPAEATGGYCVLSKDEWINLFDNHYWGFATVNLTLGGTVKGLVICPSSITTEEGAKAFLKGAVYKSSNSQSKANAYSENTLEQSTIDTNGLLFLPAAGYRNNTGAGSINSPTDYGFYWTTTSSIKSSYANRLEFRSTTFNVKASTNNLSRGQAVRLAIIK